MKHILFYLLVFIVFISCYTQIKFLSPAPEYYYETPNNYWYDDNYSDIYVSWRLHYIYYDYWDYPYYVYYWSYPYPYWNPYPWYQYYYWDNYYPYHYHTEYVAPKNYKKRDFNTRTTTATRSKTPQIKSRNKTESRETYKPRTVNRPQETAKTNSRSIKKSATKEPVKVSKPPASRTTKTESKPKSETRSVKRK